MKIAGLQRGVTLVELAIVLVVIGLLLGGILKGQELINNAKIRVIADRQNSLKVAWFAFVDRYRGLPGDYIRANQYITGAVSGDGDGVLLVNDSPPAFQHLTAAGYLRCPQCTAIAAEAPHAKNSLQNNYGGVMSIFHDGTHFAFRGNADASEAQLQIHTGPRIPSNIIAEVDRKIDDGIANAGDFVFNQYDPTTADGIGPKALQCTSTTAATHTGSAKVYAAGELFWRPASAAVESDCGGAVFI